MASPTMSATVKPFLQKKLSLSIPDGGSFDDGYISSATSSDYLIPTPSPEIAAITDSQHLVNYLKLETSHEHRVSTFSVESVTFSSDDCGDEEQIRILGHSDHYYKLPDLDPIQSLAAFKANIRGESAWSGLRQFIGPFIIAGFGNVAAGLVFDRIQEWPVFMDIPQLWILVPALLGLKGNVEMTLASRLSTHANLGHMDTFGEFKTIMVGNLALVQCQASVIGLIAPLMAIALSLITEEIGDPPLGRHDALLVIASSVVTANVANLVTGSFMCLVVLTARKININPDNIATPIAAAVGDMVSLLLVAVVSQGLYGTDERLSAALLISISVLIPLWAYISAKCSHTKQVLRSGWFSIIGALLLQSAGGLIMENGLSRFERIAAFQPIINGVGGNLAVVQSSRISTYLHRKSPDRDFVEIRAHLLSPIQMFFGKSAHSLMARLLVVITGPSHLLFLTTLYLINSDFEFTPFFVVTYLTTALLQVAVLLIICHILVYVLWLNHIDPDNFSAPFLTAFADLIGSGLLFLAFIWLFYLNDSNAFDEEFGATNMNIMRNITII